MTCPICSSPQLSKEFVFHIYEVTQCGKCQLRFLCPQPSDETLAGIYTSNYFLGDHDGIDGSEVNCLKVATAATYLQHILALRSGVPGDLLEIGSGTGDFLLEAQNRGFTVQGIELSADAVKTANRRLGLGSDRVQQGEVESALLEENFFDVVFFSDVIEHVRCPTSFISQVHRCLKPGGMVYIVTPSTDSWSHTLMGKHWMEYKIEHLYYFNKTSLSHLLKWSAFDRLEFFPNYKVLSFEYVHAHFRRFPVVFWSKTFDVISKAIPRALKSRHYNIVASGMVATGVKPAQVKS